MTLLGREVVEIDALVTDRYLDSLLSAADQSPLIDLAPAPRGLWAIWPFGDRARASDAERLDRGVRLASERLTRDLPRFHPSFRFEERLAVRLAEAAVAMRLPRAAGGESDMHSMQPPLAELDPRFAPPGPDPLGPDPEEYDPAPFSRPLLVGGAVAASAIGLAGAAWVAWRRSRANSSPMARAARVAHAMRGRPA